MECNITNNYGILINPHPFQTMATHCGIYFSNTILILEMEKEHNRKLTGNLWLFKRGCKYDFINILLKNLCLY